MLLYLTLSSFIYPYLLIVVLDLLRLHGFSNAAVAEKGLWAVHYLAYDDADNKRRLGEAGAATGELDISRSKIC